MEGVFMTTHGINFTKAGRIFVAALAITLFTGAVTGCGVKTEEQEAQEHVDKANAAIGKVNSIRLALMIEGVYTSDIDSLKTKCKGASSLDLKQWRNKLRSLMYQVEIIKAEKDQKNVKSGPSDSQLYGIKAMAGTDLEIIEAEMRDRGDIK
jgi:hypothetical protein